VHYGPNIDGFIFSIHPMTEKEASDVYGKLFKRIEKHIRRLSISAKAVLVRLMLSMRYLKIIILI
jgi:hypothetical protein